VPLDDLFGRTPSNLDLRGIEYAALRRTIATRGTARMIVAPAACAAWAVLASAFVVSAASDARSAAALLALGPLAAGFEAVHALHAGVERIGRYLQVFYEAASDGPQWETSAVRVGPALPGGGVDPLFSALFTATASVNLLLALTPLPEWPWFALLVLAHAGFGYRVWRARMAAARQRAVELESFRALLVRQHDA
jgi:hypothetical protein